LEFDLPYDQQFSPLFPKDTETLQSSPTLLPMKTVDPSNPRSQFPCYICDSMFKRQCDVE
jgi:hypothetical protein